MKNFIVIESADYADEFDIEGFKIMKGEDKEDIKKQIFNKVTNNGKSEFPIELYFGTNEYQIYNNKKEIFEDIEIKEITDLQKDTIIKLFGESFGTTAIL